MKKIYSNIIIFIVAMGGMGLSNPSSDALSSRYVENEHRGRFNSFYYISKILGTVLASCLVAWGVISNNNLILFSIIVIFFLLQYMTTVKIDYKPENKTNTFKASIKYLINSKSKYKVIIQTSIQNIIKESKEDNELLSAIGQMSLCFTEVAVFAVLAFLAKFMGENIFYVIFVLSILSTIIINLDIKLQNKKTL